MELNAQTMRAMQTNFNVIFKKAFEEAKPTWQEVATLIPSSTGSETYAWLGSMSQMRKWVGERQIKNLNMYDYTIKNENYETTISVERNLVEDDTLGGCTPQLSMMGQSAAMYPNGLVFGTLNNAFIDKCFDGQTFCSTTHPVGKNKVSNKGVAKLSLDAYALARTAMLSFKDESNATLGVVPNLLVVPPSLEGIARKICEAEYVNVGETNVYKGTARVMVCPELTSNTAWFLLDVTKPIKPLLFQERKKPEFVAKDNINDDNVFYQKQFIYGVDARGNAGYGFWQMGYGSTGETA